MRLFRAVILLAAAAIVVFPAVIALAYPSANPVRDLPDTVEKGGTFNVTVNFTAPADDFNIIDVTDFCPAGWNVTVEKTWCTPTATQAQVTGNLIEISWYPTLYANGTNFTALYKVTVPCGTSLGNYTFDEGNESHLGYYIGGDPNHIFENPIPGDSNVTVVPPAICSNQSISLYTVEGQNLENETFGVWSSTPCTINWNVTDDADYNGTDWLNATPENGSCTDVPSFIALSVNTSCFPSGPGDYAANITIRSLDANNSPRIVPVTLHITEFGTLRGQVYFTGRGGAPNARWIEPFVVKGFAPGVPPNATNASWIRNATTDDYGVFTVPDLPTGTFDVGIKNCTCLSELEAGVVLTAGNLTQVTFDPIREGDCNDNDMTNAADRGLLYDGWNSGNITQDGHLCDLNRDGAITAADRGLLYDNWNTGGAAFGGF